MAQGEREQSAVRVLRPGKQRSEGHIFIEVKKIDSLFSVDSTAVSRSGGDQKRGDKLTGVRKSYQVTWGPLCLFNLSSSFLYRLNPAPYFDALFGCLSFFSFRFFASLVACCFWPFSLSFLPPLSPIVCLLWRCQPYSCLSGTCVPHDECYQKYEPMARAGVAIVRPKTTAGALRRSRSAKLFPTSGPMRAS